LQLFSKAAEGGRIPGRWREGGARHSVRAAVANPDAPIGSQRRAEDCAPYPRFGRTFVLRPGWAT